MEPIALTQASDLINITDTLERHGLSAERVLRAAKLPMWHYCDPEDLIPSHHVYMLMDRAARSAGSATFGLLVGAEHNAASLGSFGALLLGSISTYDSLDRACRLMHLFTSHPVHFWLTEADEEIWFCRSQYCGEIGRWQMEQYIVMLMIDHVRMAAGPSWRPAKVRLQTREVPGRVLREVLGDPEIRVGQKFTGIAVPRALLAQPLRRHGTPARDRQEEEGRLRRTAPVPDFVDSLRQLAGTLLKAEEAPRIEAMAEITGISVRTLQRHLARYGLSHSQLVGQARYQAATRLLEDAEIRITDIAMELSYADSANFTRAFKRWAGVTPREYRSHLPMQ